MARISREPIRQLLGETEPYLLSGPDQWRVNCLGQTAWYPGTLRIYNHKLSTVVKERAGRYVFVECDFPSEPSREYWLVDMLNNKDCVGLENKTITRFLRSKLLNRELDVLELQTSTQQYGNQSTKALVFSVVDEY